MQEKSAFKRNASLLFKLQSYTQFISLFNPWSFPQLGYLSSQCSRGGEEGRHFLDTQGFLQTTLFLITVSLGVIKTIPSSYKPLSSFFYRQS